MSKDRHHFALIFFLFFWPLGLMAEKSPVICNANEGLRLLNQPNPPFADIHKMLQACDKKIPYDVQVLLLHGLLARKEGMKNNQYAEAITWLNKAKMVAVATNYIPALELAVTYEWANQPLPAQAIYQNILSKQPGLRPAQLGLARTEIALNHLEQASAIYTKLLRINPKDSEALNGMGHVMMGYKEIAKAASYFNEVLTLQPDNTDAQLAMRQIKQLTQQTIQLDSTIAPIFTCDPKQGLQLINQPSPPLLLVQQILLNCEREKKADVQVLLLHGLTERAQKKYPQAIEWLKKAKALATPDDFIPALELALTYEQLQQFLTAKSIYNSLLEIFPNLRPALLGKARINVWQNNLSEAQQIYAQFLKENPQDVDALNGMGRIKLTAHDYDAAKNYFNQVLQLQANNQDAKIGLQQANWATQIVKSGKEGPAFVPPKPSPCDTAQGLVLVTEKNPSLSKVQRILNYCDKLNPHDPQVFLLHGLLARTQKNYPEAITWLQKAIQTAPADNPVPAQELALTYEWSLQLEKAKAIYQQLLAKNPSLRPALLGEARVETAEYHIHQADLIYSQLLTQNPKDVDALTGMGRLKMTDKQFKEARAYFNEALQFSPGNTEALTGLQQLNNSTRYMLSFNQGQYRVQNQHSNSSALYGYADINATDRLILITTHNSKQLQLDITVEPTVLPNNALFAGFQRQIADKYGWGVNYEFRQHNNLPLETRVGGSGNLYLLKPLKWFGGFWNGFGPPWNNQLYFSGLTYYTPLPFNFTVTGFWGNQQIGGQTSTYSFDLSKEFANTTFYDVGITYTPTLNYWGYHGRLIWPTFKHQALEGSIERYDFNGITIFSLGWRVYWA